MEKNQPLNDCFACKKWTLPVAWISSEVIARNSGYPSRYFSTFDNDQLGKIFEHYWKEHLQWNEIAKFENDTSYRSEENFMDVSMVGGRGHKLAPNIQTSVKFASLRSFIFVSFQQMTHKLGNVTCQCYYFKALFLQSGWILPNLFTSQVEKKKKTWKGLLTKALKIVVFTYKVFA